MPREPNRLAGHLFCSRPNGQLTRQYRRQKIGAAKTRNKPRGENSMALIVGLDHVNLLIDTSDDAILKARAFYEDLLGLEPLERPANTDSGRAGAWYQCGPQQLHLTTEDDASSVNKSSRRHPAFRVANIESIRARLEKAGVK